MDMSIQNRIKAWAVENGQAVKTSVSQAVVVGSVFVAGAANAAIDTASITSIVTEGVTAAGVIGLAFLGFKAGIAIFKNLRGAA